MRVLVVTSMYPSPARPGLGVFVRDQVEALRAIEGLEVEVFSFEPGGLRRFVRGGRELRRAHRGERYDVVHAHYGVAGWSAFALGRAAPLLVTFHGTDLAHPVVGPMSRALARLVDFTATVSASLARSGLAGAGRSRAVPVLPCGVNLDRFAPRDRREARTRLGLPPDGRHLLFPADPARPEKRHDRAAAPAAAAGGGEPLNYGRRSTDEGPDPVHAA